VNEEVVAYESSEEARRDGRKKAKSRIENAERGRESQTF